MITRVVAAVALAGSLLFAPALIEQANAGHGGGGGHFGGGGHMGAGHFGGGHMGGAHFAGGGWHGGHMGGAHFHGGHMGGAQFAGGGWHGGGRHVAWNGGHSGWHGNNWHGHNHNHFHNDHFAHNHHFHNRFNNRFVAVGIGGWWPGYYGYGYGYGGCGWLYHEALVTGSPYWWDRYNACVGYY